MLTYKYMTQVDAICINQADLKECSAQVLRMRGIYTGAQSVLAAIHATTEEVDSILELVTLVHPTPGLENQAAAVDDLIKDGRILSAFRSFCNNSYWNRVWILQEFAINPTLDLLIGNSTVKAEEMDNVLTLLPSQPHTQQRGFADVIFEIRRSWQKNKLMSFLEMLRATSMSLCAKRHDRVFGILGLVPDGLEFLSEPDYEADLSDMSISMTQSYIERRNLDIIFLASHNGPRSKLPSWSPDYFRYDEYPPNRRMYKLAIGRHPYYESPTSGQESEGGDWWRATGNTRAMVLFTGAVLGSSARRIGSIRSLGKAWSDPDGSEFPKYDTAWARTCNQIDITSTKVLYNAILKDGFRYTERYDWRDTFRGDRGVVETYCYTHAFHEAHGNCDPEDPGNEFSKWVCANRKFFVGGRFLQDHAKRLRHPIFYSFFGTLHTDVVSWNQRPLFEHLERMASENMRLMCLDQASYGIGWAALGARIRDEVFLVPGCSSPVILRWHETKRQYKLVGDAIVIGAMYGEVWERNTPTDLVDIQIY